MAKGYCLTFSAFCSLNAVFSNAAWKIVTEVLHRHQSYMLLVPGELKQANMKKYADESGPSYFKETKHIGFTLFKNAENPFCLNKEIQLSCFL